MLGVAGCEAEDQRGGADVAAWTGVDVAFCLTPVLVRRGGRGREGGTFWVVKSESD